MAPVETAAQNDAKKAVTKPPRDRSAPVKIDVTKIAVTPAPEARRYWVGVMPDAPFDIDSRAGVGFTKFKGRTPVNDAGRVDLSIPHELGDVLELTDAQVELLVKRVGNVMLRLGSREDVVQDELGNKQIVRTAYVRSKVFLDSVVYDVNRDRKGEPQEPMRYKPAPNDVPLGYYLYCVPLAEAMPLDWRRRTPPRMCDTRTIVLES